MNYKDFEDVKGLLDNLLVQTTILTVRLNVLTSMVLGVYSETLPKQNSNLIYTNFVNLLDKTTAEALSGLSEGLYDSGSFLLKQQMEHLSNMQKMKMSDSYISDLDD